MEEFRPRSIEAPSEYIIPEIPPDIDLESAREECEATAETLANITPGYGKLPAERYLLRFEYGFTGKELADAYDVTKSTISKQTTGVRREILQFPRLSRIVGQFRVTRAGLETPESSDEPLWDSEVQVLNKSVDCTITIHQGGPNCSYSWKYRLRAELEENDLEKHLVVDYLIDAEYGVLLKRRLRGLSHSLSSREPQYQDKRQYSVYALPHPNVPTGDGTLKRAIQFHSAYDLKLAFIEMPWHPLESKLSANPYEKQRSPAYCENRTLLDRLKLTISTDPISDYSSEKHLRDNLEQILRVYPLEEYKEIPSETIDVLWNGSLEDFASDGSAYTAISEVMETSEVHRIVVNKGY